MYFEGHLPLANDPFFIKDKGKMKTNYRSTFAPIFAFYVTFHFIP
jgi:hypothetical protein